jgi:5-methylcytosine-specific restriction endonuclease McrA
MARKSPERETTSQRGYGSKWQRERLVFLAHPENQFCVKCKARGLLNPGTMRMDGILETNPRRIGLRVDHKTPHRGDQRLFWDRKNWQPLCADDHDIVKQREEHGYGEQGNDISGRPTAADHPWNLTCAVSRQV